MNRATGRAASRRVARRTGARPAVGAPALRALSGLLALALLAVPAQAQLKTYGLNQTNIFEVDINTGAATSVRTLTGPNKAALAVRPSDGLIYFITGLAGNDSVFTWDPNVPAATPTFIGRTGGGVPYLPRLAFDAAGTLHAINSASTQRYTINQTTGAATPAGAALTGGSTAGGDMVIAPNGNIYQVLGTTLYIVPPGGGALTNVGNITGVTGTFTGLAIDKRGRLLGSNSTAPATIYVIPLTAGGATALGSAGVDFGDMGTVLAVDLVISKSHSGNFTQGQTGATYSLVVSDSGNLTTSGTVTVTDTLPTGLTPVSAAGTGWTCPAPSGQVITCTRASALASGGSYPAITVTVNVLGTAPASVTNRAWVSGGGEPAGNPDLTANNSAADVTTINGQVDLLIAKSHTGNFTVGVNGVYTLTVTNQGRLATSGVITVTDVLPTGLSFVSGTAAGWTCGAAGQTVTCTSSNVIAALGGSNAITLTVGVAAAAAPSVTNSASVAGGGEPAGNAGNNTSAGDLTTVIPSANLGITKTDGVTAVNQGGTVTYTIVASNAGPNAVTAATVTDNFPAQVTGVTWTCSATAGSSCPASGSGNIAASVNLLSGGSATFTATATASGSGTISNTATVTAPGGVNDPPGNNSATDNNTVITPTADLAITKTDGVTSVNQGGTVTYTIVASNAGPTAVTGATVSDLFPAQLTGVTWTCSATAGSSCPASGSGNLSASVNLLSGGSATFLATGTVTGTGTLNNTATVAAPFGINDPAGNNSATDNNTVITPTANLGITKTDGVTAVNQGGTVTYTIVASNAGPSPVTAATVADAFPAQVTGVTWTCTASAGSSCPASGSGNISASVNLLSGGTATFTATGTASGSGTISNTATITAPGGINDPPGNNSATDNNTVITPTADLSITKTDGVTGVNQGGTVTYTIVASNAGPSAVTGATVADAFPAQLTGVTWTCTASAGSACPASGSGNISASVNLLSGGTATFTATGTASGSGTISNTATITAPGGVNDPAGNNSATDNNTVITPTADLSISKTDGVTGVNQGGTVTYTIVASNAGPTAVTGATVSDVFPAQLTGVTWTCSASAGSSCPASGSGNLNASVNLLSSGTATFTATGTVTGTGTLNNTATVAAPVGINDPAGNNSATDNNTVITPTANLGISKTDGITAVNQGDAVTYTIVASNAGPSAVTGATVADAFPAQVTGVTWTCTATAGSACPASGSGNISASVDLLNGGTATFTATGTASGSGTISNTATVTAPGGVNDPPGNNSATDNNTVITPTADLSITKTDGVTGVNQGGTVTYTIVASNAGPSAVTGATVADVFPAQLTGVTWTCAASAGSSCPASGSGNLSASVNLLSGGTATFTATGTVTGTGTLNNTATITPPGGVNDPAGNNSATDNNTVITPTADLGITKTDGLTAVNQGSTVTYTIVASNAGPGAVTGATVADVFPAQVTGVTWTCAASGGSSCPASGSGNINASVNLLNGGTATFTATGTASGSGTISNTATVTVPGGTFDPVAGNNSAIDNNTVITPTADLSIAKGNGFTTVTPGAPVTYAITVGNAGPSGVTGATVADVFPATITGVSWTCSGSGGATCPASGSGNISAVVNIPSGGSLLFTATGTVSASATGTLSNTATVTAPGGVNDPTGNNSATDADALTPDADVTVDKLGQASVVPGTNTVFTVTVTNTGPSDAVGVTVTDPTPTGLTFVSNTGACVTAYPCALGTVPAGAVRTITSTYAVPPAYLTPDPIVNSASASSSTPDPSAGNNSASASTSVATPIADLAITKSDGATTSVPGTPITYTITASNLGPSTAPGATVTDVFPATITGVTWTCTASAGSTCPPSGSGNLSTLVTLQPGGTATFLATGTISPAATGTLTNSASIVPPAGVSDPSSANNTDVNTLVPSADVSIVKTGPATVVAGTNAVYTITVSSVGPSNAANVSVSDPTPSGLTFVSNAGDCTGAFPCALGTLAPGATRTITTTFAVPATYTAPDPVVNTATVSSTTADPAAGNNTSSANSPLAHSADLSVTKTDGLLAVNQGGTVTYTIVASNAGPSAVTGATVADNFPAQLTGVTWTCAASGGSVCPASGSGNLSASVDLLNGGTATFTATGTVAGTGTLDNTATITAPGGVTDPAGNNSATDNNTVITPTADLSITKTDGVTSVIQGNTVTYTIVASNAGPSAVTAATVADVFPAQVTGVTWTCSATAGSACPASGSGNLNASVNLLAGGTATFTATGTVTGTGTISNTATVTAPGGVNDPAGNNSATDNNTVVTPTADLSITKTDGVTAVNEGGTVTYTIVASNAGPSPVTGATVTDVFPAQLTGVSWTCAASAGSVCPASGSGNLSAGVDLASGGTATFTVTATVTGTGTLSNTATITAPGGVNDPPGNNSATDNNTVITPTADLAITKTDGIVSVNQAGTVTYTIVASNAGPSPVTGATVADVFPAQLSGVTWTCAASAGSACPASGSGNLNVAVNLLSGGAATFTATATVIGTGTISNTATITAPGGVNDPAGNNSATDNNTVIVSTADLAISKTDGVTAVNQGGTVTYTIVVSNAGPSAVTGATVADNFPAQLTGVTWTCAASGGSVCPASGSGNLSASIDLLNAGTATFTATGTVTGTGTLSNTATVTAPVGTNDPAGNNSASDNNTVITPTADLSITKTDGVTGVNQGGTVTYTIAVSNAGPSAVTGATVADNFPGQLTGVTWTCAASVGSVCPASGTGDFTASVDLLSGGTATFSATGTASGAGTLVNTATVTAPGGVNDPAGNNSATDNNTVITPTADLAITKSDGLTSIAQGGTVTYAIVASNAGPTAVTGATVTDVFPAQLTGVTWTCTASAGSTCPATGSGNLGAAIDLLSGGTATFLATATVTGTGTLDNTATVTAPGGINDPAGNNSATDNNTVITATADLSITKSDGVAAVNQGGTVTYTIVASNAGPSGVTGATLTDLFPAQLTGVTWTCAASAGSACPAASGSGNLNALVDLLSGGTVTVTATATVTGTGTLDNTATITAPVGVNDPAGNNSATDNNTVITPTADLSITKTDGVTAVNQGGTVTYTIVASNAGPSAVTGATVTDVFPAQLTGETWTCVASAGSVCPASGSGNLSASVDLLSGGTATFTATGTATGAGTLNNTATIAAPAGFNDPPGNNSATDNNTVITPTADLAISKTDGVVSVTQGGTVTYTIVASNAGPSDVAGATVTDAFPAQLSSVAWTCAASPGSSCPASGAGNISATVNLVSGGAATFTATATVTGTGTLSNTATITAPGGVNDPAGNNSATDNNTVITATADLSITKTDGLTAVNQGGTVTYTIVVGNAGPSAVTGATVTDVFPAQLTGATWTCVATGGSACPASGSGNINASVDLLSSGTATFTALAMASGSGTISNTATVTAPVGVNDPAGNNSATDNNTVITPTADLAITKTDGVVSVNQGGTVTYTIVASNAGPSAVTGATVTDNFPAQLTGVTWTCTASAGSACPASGGGNLSATVDLLSGGTATFTATGTVTGTGTLSNTATVTAPGGVNDPAGNNSATDNNTVITTTADLAITKTDGVTAVVQGGTVTYAIVASNAGPSPVTGATVTDLFPAQLTGVTWTCAATAGSSCPASGSGNLNAAVNLLSGGTATFTAAATVTGTGTLNNTATITAPVGTNDPAGNNSATDNNTVITPTADLAITKTDGVTSVVQGGTVTYTIAVSNAGPGAVTGATVADVFPSQLAGVTWTCAASAGSACPASGSGDLNASVSLLSGGTATFTATATVSGTGTLSNTATVTAPVGINDPAGNNSATDNNTVITASADLAITKTDGVTSVNEAGTVTYTIVVSNAGPGAATGATVTDNFPAQLTGVSWTCVASAGSACPASGGGNLNALVDLLSGGTATFTATATVTGAGTLSNTATVAAPIGVVDPAGNNSATDNNTVITPTADLTITKTDGVTTVTEGGTLTYTIVARNLGPSAVTAATVSDVFPAQVTGVTWTCAASGGSACPASGSGNISASVNLLSGGTATFTATGTATGSGTISNTATIAAPVGVNDPAGNNSATDNNTLITATADLAITKTDGVTAVNQGGTVTYTIVVSNAGPSAAVGATVDDVFPAELTGVTWTCAASAGSVCPASGSGDINATIDLPSGGTATFTATGTVTGTGTLNNTATVTAPSGVNDPPANNSATDNNTVITPTADLSITKSNGAASVVPGLPVTYAITVGNAGPSAVTGATVTDVFPAVLTGVTWTCTASGGSSCPASGSGNINASVNLLNGGTLTFLATGTVASGATGTISNTATAAAPLGLNDPAGNNSATDADPLVPSADVSVSKSGPATVTPGTTVTYTVVVTNTGPSDAVSVSVADPTPAGLLFVSNAGDCTGAYPCALGTLTPGATRTITTVFSVPPGYTTPDPIVNTATAASPTADPAAGNNTAMASTSVGSPIADLSITKTDGSAVAVPGASITYTITASNAGPSAANGATVADVFPPEITGVTWTCSASAGSSCPASGSGDLAVTVNLASGGSVVFLATGTISPAATGTLVNAATVTPPPGVSDPTSANNTDVNTLVPSADVSVTKTGPATIVPGTNVVYTITVSNAGPSNAASVSVSDPTPAGLAFLSNAGDCTSTFPCALGTVPPGATRTITTTYAVPSTYAGADPVVNTATVSSPTSDPQPSNNSAAASAPVGRTADLAITKTDGVTSVNQGGAVTYTLVVTNAGPSAVTGATVTDAFPAQLSAVAWTCVASAGSACPASGSGDLNTSVDLLSGGTLTFTATATVLGTGTLSNTATVTAPAGVTDAPGNNSATDNNTVITASADLSITKTDGVTAVTQGGTVTYTIVAGNAGPSAVTGATVTDNFPAQLSGVTWTCTASAGSVCPASGSGDLNATVDLLIGGTATFVATATVAGTGTISNTATITAPGGTNDPAGNNSATDNNTVITPTADLAITKTDGVTAVNQGGALTWTIVASNAGPSAVTGAAVTDNFPAQVSGVTWTCAASAGSVCPASGSGNLNATVDLLSGGTATFTATGTVSAGSGTISNTATVTAPVGVNDPAGNNSATDNNTVIAATADLSITKTDGVVTVNQGGTVTYTIVASNGGPSAVTGATVTDLFPAGLAGVTWTCAATAGSACPASGSGDLNATVDLLAGGAATFTATATVIGTGTLNNTATITAPVGINDPAGNNSATDNNTVITATADLAITKTDGVTAVNQGGTVTYTIVASNAGPNAVTGATVVDNLPAQLTGVTWACAAAGGAACPASGSGNLNVTVDLPVGGTTTFTVTATVSGTGTLSNTATITAPGGVTDAPGNNSATDNNTVITPTADLSITKTDGVAAVSDGGTVTYTIVARNAGPSAVTGATVTDVFPAQLSGVTWTCAASAGAVCPASGSGNINATVDLPSGGTATFTASATVSGSGTITNTATVTAPAGVNDPAGNNSATDNTTISPAADLSITKTDGVATTNVGSTLTYTIVASNAGPSAVTGATVTDNLPAQLTGATWTCAAAGGAACPASGSGNIAASVNLPVGGSVTFTLTATVAAGGTISNTATIAPPAGASDPVPGNNSATDATTANAPDLAIAKTHAGNLTVGVNGTYTLTATNAGTAPTIGAITVTDTLPAGLGFVSGTGTGWTCSASGAVVTCVNPGPFAPAAASPITLTVSVGAAAAPSVSNRAWVATAGDGNAANDSAIDVATVISPVDVAIAKDPVGVFRVGGTGEYLLTISNVGTVSTTGPLTIIDTLPAGLTYQSFTGTGWSCAAAGAVVTCTAPTLLAPGTSAAVTLTVDVGPAALPSVTNTASVSTAGDLLATGNNVVSTSPVLVIDASLTVEKSADRSVAELTDVIDYRVVVRASGTTAITDAVVDDDLPSGFTYVNGTARVDGIPIADPVGTPGPRLRFTVGTVPLGGSVTLSYRVVVGAGAQRGDGTNRAQASSALAAAVSNLTAVKVRVEGGVFTDRGMIVGKVYLECECDSTRAARGVTQAAHEVGIPGVRVLLEDGTAVITDVEGKYSFYGVSPRRHVVRVDRATLPAGSRLLETGARNAGDPVSRFVDLTRGELHVAEFAVLRTDELLALVRARRNQGEVYGLVRDTTDTVGVFMGAGGVAGGGGVSGGGASGVFVPTGGAVAGGDTPRGIAPAVPGVYRPLLSAPQPLGSNTGLAPSLLATDGSASAAGARVGTGGPAARRLEVRLPMTTLPADGLTQVPVAVRMVDAMGNPISWSGIATLETSLGRWAMADLDLTEPGTQAQLVAGIGRFALVAPGEAGAGEVRVTADGLSTTTPAYFVPAPRPLLANGVVQGRINLRSLSADALSPARDEDGFEAVLRDVAVGGDGSGLQAGARSALYLRGKVRGDYLLTLAFDTERDPDARLMRDIQPDEFYPVYGDASVREFDARSAGRLYVRIDRQQSFLMIGDFTTPVAQETRTLAAYSRALTGARQHLEGARGTLDAFASQGRLSQVVDEIPGQGISGPYTLSRTDGRMNTERVEILTRDRNQPRLIVKAEPQARFTDYSIEPFTGRILFRRPVPSLDAQLNPISIRVIYEVEQGGDAYWMAGITGQTRLTGRAEVGATVVRDANPMADRTLLGVNATVRVRENTYLLGEMARTDGDSLDAGVAGRVELRHQSARVDFRAFYAQSDSAFSNPSSTFGSGRGEAGLRTSLRLAPTTRLLAEALRTQDRITGGQRDGASIGVERSFGARARAELGYRYANETATPASPLTGTPGATPNETSALRARLTADLLDQRRASVYGEFEQDIRTSDQQRAALGADVRVGKRTRLYARHELLSSFAGPYALNGAQQTGNTVLGLDADYLAGQQVFSEYRVRDAFAGRDAEAALGLRNRWTLGRGMVANTSFERVERVRGSGPEATAVTGAFEYTRNPLWRGTARLEYRDATGGDSWLGTLGYARKISRDITLLGRSLYSEVGGTETRAKAQFGVALRQTDTDTWNALARYEFRYEDLHPAGLPTALTRAHILSAHLNVRLRPDFVLSGQYAARLATSGTDGVETRPTAQLLGLRGLLDIGEKWDAGLITRILANGDLSSREFGLGAEIGRRMARNLRLALGTNFMGFRDDGLAGVASTVRGFYIDLGWKFGEEIFGTQPNPAPAVKP